MASQRDFCGTKMQGPLSGRNPELNYTWFESTQDTAYFMLVGELLNVYYMCKRESVRLRDI